MLNSVHPWPYSVQQIECMFIYTILIQCTCYYLVSLVICILLVKLSQYTLYMYTQFSYHTNRSDMPAKVNNTNDVRQEYRESTFTQIMQMSLLSQIFIGKLPGTCETLVLTTYLYIHSCYAEGEKLLIFIHIQIG